MQPLRIGPYHLLYDANATRTAHALRRNDSCTCAHCRNWAAARRDTYANPAFRQLLDTLGLPLDAFAGGCVGTIPVAGLFNHWYHLRGAYTCWQCGREVHRPGRICPCRLDDPDVRRMMAAAALRRGQRFRHVRPRRLLAVLTGYAAVAAVVACVRPIAPGLRHAPVYPDLLLTHMMLCFGVLVVGHVVVEALRAFRRTRFRYRPRVQMYLLLFSAVPLVVLLAWTCGVVLIR